MTLDELSVAIRSCRRCEHKLAEYGVEPRPIFWGAEYPVVVIGQAPGITEYRENAPFQGAAGKSLRALFESCGLADFDRKVYQTSVAKCFPGGQANSSTDRRPSASEVKNCAPFLVSQMALLKPRLIVILGSLAWESFASIREHEEPGYCMALFQKKNPKMLRVPDLVGRRFQRKAATVLPMIHPAGSANGARAKHPKLDLMSKRLLREELEKILTAGLIEAPLELMTMAPDCPDCVR